MKFIREEVQKIPKRRKDLFLPFTEFMQLLFKGNIKNRYLENIYLINLKIACNISERKQGSGYKQQVTFLITCFREKAI